jgi:integral membrane sensor domain MASE1
MPILPMGDSQVQHVFINCPFDPQYRSLFEAIVFAVSVCGVPPAVRDGI